MAIHFRWSAKFFASLGASRIRFGMKNMSSLLAPPPCVRGSEELNRELFTKKVTVPFLQLRTESLSKIMPILKKYILKLPRLRPVQNKGDTTVAYLDPKKVKDFNDIPEDERTILILKASGKFDPNGELTLTYDNFTANEVLKAVMPNGMEVPTSFSTIGHIIHLNLQDFQLPFSKVIGQVYLDKIPNVTTVVNKSSNIDSTYRFFNMDVLVGDTNTIVTVKENKCTFTFDFAKVYWNPRLSTEHQNITNLLTSQDVMYDVFAGVGPFAIPVAKKRATVLANDLNPESYTWLQKNAESNKIKTNLSVYNMDGREFIESIVKKHLLERRANCKSGSEHFVMNLPASAVDFLDVFHRWLTGDEADIVYSRNIHIHVYCFVKLQKNEEAVEKAKCLVEEKLGCRMDSDILTEIHFVRNVAPNKEMMRVSFLLTKKMMEYGEPAMKKLKTDNNGDGNQFVGQDGAQTNTAETEGKCFQAEGSSDNEGQESTKS